MSDRLRVGVITSTHGIRGEVKVFPTTDDPARFAKLDQVYICGRLPEETLHVEKARVFKNQVIVKFREYNDINEVEKFRKSDILIDRKDAEELKEDEFFIDDLVGLTVSADNGRFLGRLKEVYETGANDVFVIEKENGKELLIPATKECVTSVNLDQGQMTVHLLPGLEDLNG
ncbi:MAG: ribosome maturation factor RimM [Lachnospiraceae bacterium]|nr:ribosome maturation factor RimM [Lachnospiraceae bacterium]